MVQFNKTARQDGFSKQLILPSIDEPIPEFEGDLYGNLKRNTLKAGRQKINGPNESSVNLMGPLRIRLGVQSKTPRYQTMQLNGGFMHGVGNFSNATNVQSSIDDASKFAREENLYHGLSPKQFVDELDRQVNLKKLIAQTNDSYVETSPKGKLTKQPIKIAKQTSHRRSGGISAGGSSHKSSDSAMRDSIMSHNSNMSTATDRLKRILKKKPIHIIGAGFNETPY